MPGQHWFHSFRFNRKYLASASRRDVVRAVAALFPGLAFSGLTESALGKPGDQGSGKRTNNGKTRDGSGKDHNVSVAAATGDACRANWPGSGRRARRNRRHCRFVRRQCDGDDPRDFCIVEDYEGHEGEKVAVCCNENQKCCGGTNCCDRDAQCCGSNCCGSAPDFQCCHGACFNTNRSDEHCGGCDNPCPVGQFCEEGRCVCPGGPCDPACPVGETFCNGECVDTQTDPRHCGGCNAFNPNGLKCCNGNLCTYIDGLCCGSTCYPSYYTSCP